MTRRSFLLPGLLASGLAIAWPSFAEVAPASMGPDARVRSVLYSPVDVIRLDTQLRVNTAIELGAGERIDSVLLGDSEAFEVEVLSNRTTVSIKPVIGGAAGGIPAQIIHGETGFLVNSPEGAAYRIRYLLSHPHIGVAMGGKGREHVRYNFLITRHVRDYLLLMLHVMSNESEKPIFVSGPAGKRIRRNS